MDIRSSSVRNSNERVKVEDTPVTKENTIRLQLLVDVIYKAKGLVTGKWYIFPGAGSIVNVDERDAQVLLERRMNTCNCSGLPGNLYFQKV